MCTSSHCLHHRYVELSSVVHQSVRFFPFSCSIGELSGSYSLHLFESCNYFGFFLTTLSNSFLNWVWTGDDCACNLMKLSWHQHDLIVIVISVRYFSRGTSCESVRLLHWLARAVRDLKVESWEPKRPVGLSPGEVVCLYLVFKILIIRDHHKFWKSLEVVMPAFESLNDRHEFFVVNFVITFKCIHCFGSVCNRVP